MPDLIIYSANFGVEKLRGLGNTRGQILEFPIEMAGHPYNRAGYRAACDVRTRTNVLLFIHMDMRACNFILGGRKIASDFLTSPSLRTENNTEPARLYNAIIIPQSTPSPGHNIHANDPSTQNRLSFCNDR